MSNTVPTPVPPHVSFLSGLMADLDQALERAKAVASGTASGTVADLEAAKSKIEAVLKAHAAPPSSDKPVG